MIDLNILSAFNICGEIVNIIPYGNGHINDTYLVTTTCYKKYIFQSINHNVFKKPKKLMKNIALVTSFMAIHEPCYRGISIVETKRKKYCYHYKKTFWRCYHFIEEASTFEYIEDLEIVYETGKALGSFEKSLNGFPMKQLYVSIPHFHDSIWRYNYFKKVINKDKNNLVTKVRKEIHFIKRRHHYFELIENGIKEGTIRVVPTHNDPKTNNIMISKLTNKSVCLIDLDTVMPGSILYDFGDAIRSIASVGAEDEVDLRKISIDIDRYEAFTSGYLDIMSDTLTEKEKELLVDSAIIITLECAMRFLTDYLQGNIYFKVDDEEHNLRRTRASLKLVQSLELNRQSLKEIVNKCLNKKE